MLADLLARFWLAALDIKPQSGWLGRIIRLPLVGFRIELFAMRKRDEAWGKLVAQIPHSSFAAAEMRRWLQSDNRVERACGLLCDAIDAGWRPENTIAPDFLSDLIAHVKPNTWKWRDLLEKLIKCNAEYRDVLERCLGNDELRPKVFAIFKLEELPSLGVSDDVCLSLLENFRRRHLSASSRDFAAENATSRLIKVMAGGLSRQRIATILRQWLLEGLETDGPFLDAQLLPLVPACFDPDDLGNVYRELLASRSALVRAGALTQLLKCNGARTILDDLLRATYDPASEVVKVAVKGLEQLPHDARVVERVFEGIEVGDAFFRWATFRRSAAESPEHFHRLCQYFHDTAPAETAKRASACLPSSSDYRVPLETIFRCLATGRFWESSAAAELGKWEAQHLRPFLNDLVAVLRQCKPHNGSYNLSGEPALSTVVINILEFCSWEDLTRFVPVLVDITRNWGPQSPERVALLRLLSRTPRARADDCVVAFFVELACSTRGLACKQIAEFVDALDDRLTQNVYLEWLIRDERPRDDARDCIAIEKVTKAGQSAIAPLLSFGLRNFSGLSSPRPGHVPHAAVLNCLNQALIGLIDDEFLLERITSSKRDYFLLQLFFQYATRKCQEPLTKAKLIAASRFVGCSEEERSTAFIAASFDVAMIYLEALLQDLELISDRGLERMCGIWHSDGGSGMSGYWAAEKGELQDMMERAQGWCEQRLADPTVSAVAVQQETGEAACLRLFDVLRTSGKEPRSVRIAHPGSYRWIERWVPYADASTLPESDRDYSALTR